MQHVGIPILPFKGQEVLRILAILHYVLAGMLLLVACFPVFTIGFTLMTMNESLPEVEATEKHLASDWVILGVYFGLLLLILGAALLSYLSGRKMSKLQDRKFSIGVASFIFFLPPFGSALGAFTVFWLSRPTVIRLYEGESKKTAPAAGTV